MAGSNHNGACANAVGHACRCSGCGGALHGWQGWLDLAGGDPETRRARRKDLEDKNAEAREPKTRRQVVMDLARLDVAEFLARTSQREVVDHSADATDGAGGQAGPTSELDYLVLLARRTMADTWREVVPELERVVPAGVAVGEVRREMATHLWCDLLIALVQLVQDAHDALGLLSEKSKIATKRILLMSSKRGLRRHVAEGVVDLVVGKFWLALRGLIVAKIPILGPAGLRALRMLAMFSCPAPEAHYEVYEHAVVPLMKDVHGMISEEVKAQVVALVSERWRRHTIAYGG